MTPASIFSRTNGPCTGADLDAVENRLGRRIPASYRDLLRRTGGGLLDDDHRVFPDVRSAAPWADGYRISEINGVADLARDTVAEIFGAGWGPAGRVITVAGLPGNRPGWIVVNCGIEGVPDGAVLAMTPGDRTWRVLAVSFGEFLGTLGRAWPGDPAGTERECARHGAFSPALAGALDALAASGTWEPEVPLRALAERIIDAKDYLGLHGDADSRLFLDVLYALTVAPAGTGPEPRTAAEFHARLTDLVGDSGDTGTPTVFRLTYGCSPVFVDEWWDDRDAARGRGYLGSAAAVRRDRLLHNLDRGIDLYHRFRVTPWEQWLRTDRARIAAGDADGLTHMRSAYGGMGSINDLYICPWNGHPVTEAEWNPVTDRHEEIISAISADVRALLDHGRTGDRPGRTDSKEDR